MERDASLLRLAERHDSSRVDSVDLSCNRCGGSYQKPILATVSCGGEVQKYYACPRCMVKISEELKEITVSRELVEEPEIRYEKSVKCRYSFGYLKKRPKDAPIPDECLTCDKMVECMIS